MKKPTLFPMVLVLLFICGCTDYEHKYEKLKYDYEILEFEHEELEYEYENLSEELQSELQSAIEYKDYEINHLEEYAEENFDIYEIEIDYYEALCDVYGYLTYNQVYEPEECVYVSNDIQHHDWLCEDFDRNSPYDFNYSDEIVVCENCYNDEEWISYLLDEETGVFHLAYADKECLDLGTKDFKIPNKTYRLVHFSSAVEHNYIPCPNCINKEQSQ